VKLLYHSHGSDGRIRVWRSDWSHDVFEVLTPEAFISLRHWCDTFQIKLINVEDMSQEEIDELG